MPGKTQGTVGPSGPSAEPKAVEAERIHADLEMLRKNDGITPMKLKDAGAILDLPIVRQHMADHGYDAHTAAYEVLECLAHSVSLGPRYGRIIQRTLNFAPRTGDRLTARREDLKAELHAASDMGYPRLEAHAYSIFVHLLITLHVSPCGALPMFTDEAMKGVIWQIAEQVESKVFDDLIRLIQDAKADIEKRRDAASRVLDLMESVRTKVRPYDKQTLVEDVAQTIDLESRILERSFHGYIRGRQVLDSARKMRAVLIVDQGQLWPLVPGVMGPVWLRGKRAGIVPAQNSPTNGASDAAITAETSEDR